jgi:hypothetical protein
MPCIKEIVSLPIIIIIIIIITIVVFTVTKAVSDNALN